MPNYLKKKKNDEINTPLVSNFLQMNSIYKEKFAATELCKHYIHNVWNKNVSIRKLARKVHRIITGTRVFIHIYVTAFCSLMHGCHSSGRPYCLHVVWRS
jgi:hypothetical protein